ncbi:MAG TPA: hypothetical protein DCX95_04100 [Elusimicrobia bacterium]|nr:hypothetical protein [Elusimicrobiota bacterium]
MTKNDAPEKSAVNIDIEKIEENYFSKEKYKEKRRGKAFQYLCLSTICDLNLDEIDEEDIIDGGDEEGIDIIFIKEIENNLVVNIFNCNSSLTNNYSANEMTKISAGINYVFESTKDQINKISNIKLKKKIFDIRSDKETISEINIFYCVFNGKNIAPNVERKRGEIQKRYSSFLRSQYPNAKLSIEFINFLALFKRKMKNLESLKDRIVEIPYYDKDKKIRSEILTGEIEGYLTTFKSQNIAKLVEDYGDALFEKNIRGWLRYNKKNREIYDSCSGLESNIFWFLNNGITMTGDKVYADDDKAKWTITNLQIVNGQQTARMIHEAYKNQKLKKDVKVMCRIYQLNNYNIISKITKATNLQSSISGRDLMSNDPKQIAIADCFEEMGYFYERQRGEIRISKKYKSNISSKKLAQISLGILCKKPSLARKNMEDNFFNTNKNYYEIFDRNPKELLLAYLLYKYCNNSKNDKDELKYFGVLHIGRIIWEIKKNEFIEDMDKTIKAFEEQKNNLSSEYENALKILKEIFKQEKTSIENLGHYLSRIEVDDLIFRKLQEKTAK